METITQEKITQYNQDDIINFTNIDNDDFVNGWGQNEDGSRKNYRFAAGETKQLPRFKAYGFAKHLIDHILRKQGKDYGEPSLREELEKKIFGLVAVSPSPVE